MRRRAARSRLRIVSAPWLFSCTCLRWALSALRRRETRGYALMAMAAVLLQAALGVGNVVLGLPLPVATAHNGGAAVLLLTLLALRVRLRPDPHAWSRW